MDIHEPWCGGPRLHQVPEATFVFPATARSRTRSLSRRLGFALGRAARLPDGADGFPRRARCRAGRSVADRAVAAVGVDERGTDAERDGGDAAEDDRVAVPLDRLLELAVEDRQRPDGGRGRRSTARLSRPPRSARPP